MSRAQSYIYQILSRPPNTKIAGPTTHSTFHTWLSKKIGPTKWPAKNREGRKKMTLMILKFLTWESGESKKFQFSRTKINRRIVAIFGKKIELQNFKLIGKTVKCLIFSPKIQNYSLEKKFNFRAKNGQHFPVNYWRKNWTILIENPWNFSFLHLRKELNFRAKNGQNMSVEFWRKNWNI